MLRLLVAIARQDSKSPSEKSVRLLGGCRRGRVTWPCAQGWVGGSSGCTTPGAVCLGLDWNEAQLPRVLELLCPKEPPEAACWSTKHMDFKVRPKFKP